MRLGIGLPNTLVPQADRRLVLEWARVADDAGFHSLGTIDKPNYDSWDPLITLAGAAAVTERARLATTIIQLPNRNEVLVAKQAAVVDRLSGGRLDLGLAVGGRADDFEAFDSDFSTRGRRMAGQVAHIRAVWTGAREADDDAGVLGPPPIQEPGPPIWLGGSSEAASERAVQLGDGFIFGTAGIEAMTRATPALRERAAAGGKTNYRVIGLAYAGLGDDPGKALEEASHFMLRYYGTVWRDPAEIIHHGPPGVIEEAVAGYAASGIDELIVFPLIPDLRQVELLAENVLPAYR